MPTQLELLEAAALTLAERAELAQVPWGSIAEGQSDVDEPQAPTDARRRDAEMALA